MNENAEFFKANQPILIELIDQANAKRASQGQPQLTNEEIDFAVTEMRNNPDIIPTYKFKAYVPPPQIRQTPKATGDKFHFDVTKCANGFLLNLNHQGQAQTFIFRDKKELSDILEILFRKEENGRSSEEVRGGSGEIREGDFKPPKPTKHRKHSLGDQNKNPQ